MRMHWAMAELRQSQSRAPAGGNWNQAESLLRLSMLVQSRQQRAVWATNRLAVLLDPSAWFWLGLPGLGQLLVLNMTSSQPWACCPELTLIPGLTLPSPLVNIWLSMIHLNWPPTSQSTITVCSNRTAVLGTCAEFAIQLWVHKCTCAYWAGSVSTCSGWAVTLLYMLVQVDSYR